MAAYACRHQIRNVTFMQHEKCMTLKFNILSIGDIEIYIIWCTWILKSFSIDIHKHGRMRKMLPHKLYIMSIHPLSSITCTRTGFISVRIENAHADHFNSLHSLCGNSAPLIRQTTNFKENHSFGSPRAGYSDIVQFPF